MPYDVVIIGGGPAGLSAALALGRATRRVLLLDAGARRNAAAEHLHNFVTRDGTPPEAFRSIARKQLETYPSVEIRDARADRVTGSKGAFCVEVAGASVEARRIVLCTGMVDERLPIEGWVELWGHAIFQCPYCHGWEVRERKWGYLARESEHAALFTTLLRSWTSEVTLFTSGAFELDPKARAGLEAAGIVVNTEPVARLRRTERTLEGVELADGTTVPCDVLYAHPPQHHVEPVLSLGLELDEFGYVRADPMTRETSVPGIYAAGDLTSRAQGAIFAAANGTQAGAMLNHGLAAELAIGS